MKAENRKKKEMHGCCPNLWVGCETFLRGKPAGKKALPLPDAMLKGGWLGKKIESKRKHTSEKPTKEKHILNGRDCGLRKRKYHSFLAKEKKP